MAVAVVVAVAVEVAVESPTRLMPAERALPAPLSAAAASDSSAMEVFAAECDTSLRLQARKTTKA